MLIFASVMVLTPRPMLILGLVRVVLTPCPMLSHISTVVLNLVSHAKLCQCCGANLVSHAKQRQCRGVKSRVPC